MTRKKVSKYPRTELIIKRKIYYSSQMRKKKTLFFSFDAKWGKFVYISFEKDALNTWQHKWENKTI